MTRRKGYFGIFWWRDRRWVDIWSINILCSILSYHFWCWIALRLFFVLDARALWTSISSAVSMFVLTWRRQPAIWGISRVKRRKSWFHWSLLKGKLRLNLWDIFNMLFQTFFHDFKLVHFLLSVTSHVILFTNLFIQWLYDGLSIAWMAGTHLVKGLA